MENKEKIVLKDGTQIEIENGAIENCIQVFVPDLDSFKTTYEKFTENNLEKYTIQNATGLTCATYENKYLANAIVVKKENNFLVHFNLSDVDMVAKRLSTLEESQKELKESQNIQDIAIDDLGNTISDLVSENEVGGEING